MRLFTGIDIPGDVRARLRALLDRLRPLARMKWSPVEKLHITTKFIGEWPQAELNQVETALAAVPKPGPIQISIQGLGWFPNPHSSRMFWATVQADPTLQALAKDTEEALATIGVPREDRDFRPHLTLARARPGMSKESLAALRRAVASLDSHDFGSFRASAQILYLSAEGKHTQLRAFSLLPS